MTSYHIGIPRNEPFDDRDQAFTRPWLHLVLKWTVAACQRARTRRHLAQLEPHLLRDVGLTPDNVASECAKPFWL